MINKLLNYIDLQLTLRSFGMSYKHIAIGIWVDFLFLLKKHKRK